MKCGAKVALALALVTSLAACASADKRPRSMPVAVNPIPLPPPGEWRPSWWNDSYTAIVLPDSRAREQWLRECHRRMTPVYDYGSYDNYGDYYRSARRHGHDRGHVEDYTRGNDNCEAYFDDYYHYQAAYAQRAYASSYQSQTTTYQSGGRQVEEVVTERYEPIRSRIIQHRRARPVIHDKRIRIAP